MLIEADWTIVGPSTRYPRICAHAIVTDSKPPSEARKGYVESFVSANLQIFVEFNDIPISSFVVHVHHMDHETDGFELPIAAHHPTRFHFGSSFTTFHEWRHANDIYFEPLSPASESYVTSYQFLSEGTRLPSAISFVIQLSDGSWLRDHDGKDFHAGSLPSICPPSCVELPFKWPVDSAPRRILSLNRVNPFWLVPHFAPSLSECENETFCILAELDSMPEVTYAAAVFCVDADSGIRSSFFATSAPDSVLAMRLETGLSFPLRVSQIHGSLLACVACRNDPYDAVHDVIVLMAENGIDVSTAGSKMSSDSWASLQSPLLSRLGYCTWDAFGNKVSMVNVVNAVEWLHGCDIPIGYVIVDDGWQTVTQTDGQGGDPHSAVLSAFRANGKFDHSLRGTVDKLDAKVLAWTSVLGYWGGASLAGEAAGAIGTVRVLGRQARGLHVGGVEDPRYWEREYDIIDPTADNLATFFEKYFVDSMAKSQGISGVKIDAQSILDLVCPASDTQLNMTRLELTRLYRTAFSKAVTTAFPEAVIINCMACGPEAILFSGVRASGSNMCWRTSNDHAFPNVEEDASAVAWHVLTNAMVSVFLGEVFPLVDWDMFRVAAAADGDGRFARVHAVARVLSGGPVYISDFAPFTDGRRCQRGLHLLRRLTTSDGRLLRCFGAGRPTRDCLFHDVREGNARLLKVFNRNSVNGVLAMFNLRYGNEKGIVGKFCPGDVRDFAVLGNDDCCFVSLVCDQEGYFRSFVHSGLSDPCKVQVRSLDVALIHVCPVLEITDGVSFCAIGHRRILNGGGVVRSIGYSIVGRRVAIIDVSLEDCGDCLLWMQLDKDMEVQFVKTCEGLVDMELCGLNDDRLFKVCVPSRKPHNIQLRVAPKGSSRRH